jgi:pyrroline-5-carboxylate reductase
MAQANQRIELPGPLLLAGSGKMGGALLAGWLARGLAPADVLVQDPGPPEEVRALLAAHAIRAEPRIAATARPPAVLLLAVKPQIMDEVLPPLAGLVGPETLVISVAAGRTLASFERQLPPRTAIVRSIPNTPAAIGRGISVCVANAHVRPAGRARTEMLLGAVGEVSWVAEEDLIDVATAVSGSGPAYVFLLAECLAEAGRAAGLDAALARRLADATVSGSGELLRRSGVAPDVLRRNVTSPNGTTAAALAHLMAEDGLQPLLTRAVAAAARRSRELST